MSAEYRFSLTPRLVGLGAFSLLALFVLLFLLGVEVGHRSAATTSPVAGELSNAARAEAVKAEQAVLKHVPAAAQPAAAALVPIQPAAPVQAPAVAPVVAPAGRP